MTGVGRVDGLRIAVVLKFFKQGDPRDGSNY